MKTSLVGLIVAFLGAVASARAADPAPKPDTEEAHATVLTSPDLANFQSSPGVPACTRAVPMRGNPAKGGASFMAKMEPGCVVPFHWHSVNEELLILEGNIIGQMRGQPSFKLGPRGYAAMPAHHVHRFMCAKTSSCTVFVVVDGVFDLHYVNAADVEIPLEQALTLDKTAKGDHW